MGKKKTWFQKGAFEDGYQFGDVYNTVQGTIKDVKTNFLAGAAGIAEKAIDAGAYVVGGVGGLLGADKFKDRTEGFIKKDLINEEKIASVLSDHIGTTKIGNLIDNIIGADYKEKYDEYSLLGEKSDALVQSGGQLAAQIALQTFAYVPWWATTGVTSFGGSVEQNFNEGAGYGQAGLNAAITTGADILTEKLFAGSGLGEKGLIKLDRLTKGISNKAIKTLVDWGLDVGSEGFEEVSAAFVSRLGKALTYEKEDTWREILTNERAMDRYIKNIGTILFGKEAREEYKEAGIGGMFLGGGANVGNVVNSIKQGTDYRTGLTENEQKVFDNIYQKNIDDAKIQKGEKKLTRKDKRAIYSDTIEKIKNGNIDAQTIESALGGEDYSAYINALGNYDALQQKFNEIQAIDNELKTQEQLAIETNIKQRLEQTRLEAEKLKNILKKRVAEKIDTDNIRLRDRESYLWDGYIKGIEKPSDSKFEDSDSLKSIDDKAFVKGLWEDSPNNSEENVEKSQLKSVENIGENSIIEETRVLTLDDLTRDVLKTKPRYSPNPKRWIKKEGSIAIDKDGNWIYTDCNGVTVKYIDGYPDFESAGTVEQKVNIGEFRNRSSDARKADKLAPNGPRKKGYVWHHSPDGCTMMEISEYIHKKFTHMGGYAIMNLGRRN